MKEKYHGSEKTKKSSVKQCLFELGEFKQEDNTTIELYYDRLKELIFRCTRYGVTRMTREYMTFLMGLRKEWRNISLMIKFQQNLDGFCFG